MKAIRGMSLALVIVINIILLLTSSGTAQAIMLRLSLDDISVNADTVVVGTVMSKTSQWNAERTHINTTVVIAVEDTFKGAAGQKTVTVTVPGGTVDGMTEWVEHAAEFQPGERSVVFLKRLSDSRHEVYGQQQGRHPVVDGKVGGVALSEFKGRVSQAIQEASTPTRQEPRKAGAAVLPRDTRQPEGPVSVNATKLSDGTPAPQSAAVKSPGWQTILSDGFEGAFPGSSSPRWWLYGSPTWGATTYDKYSGTRSVWNAGSSMNPAGNYANNMNAWMVYGPINLSDASAGDISYYRSRRTEADFDVYGLYASVNFNPTTGAGDFWGWSWSGGTGSWARVSFDWREWAPTLNLLGQSQVYVAFKFQSDESVTDRGVFLDDVVLRKYVGAVPAVSSITPSSASAGTSSNVTISGTGFGTTPGSVEFFYRDGQPHILGSIISWTNTSIVTTVPTGVINGYNATASSGPVWVVNSEGASGAPYPFTVTFSYGGRKWAGASPVVSYRVNPNTPDATGEEVAVQSAAATWTAVPNKSFAFNYAGATTATASTQNFVNEVLWRTGLPTGVLAWAIYWWDGTGSIVETDIEFNETYTWTTSGAPAAGQYDVQTIAVHEMGHWLNLRDMYGDRTGFPMDSGKIMFGFGPAGATKRVLHAADIAGIQWIYPAATTPPTVTTDNATNVTSSSATLNGTVTSLGTSSNVTRSFQWGTSTNYTSETSGVTANATGPFSFTLTGLPENTTYHYRAKVVGSSGTAYGVDKTFTTPPAATTPPAVTTDNATNVTSSSATLNGTVTSLGTSSNVTRSFQWGTSTNYTSETTGVTANATGAFSSNLTGLSENTTYHYRAKAVGDSTSYGSDRAFTTPPTLSTVVVTSNPLWTDTGLNIEIGDQVNITASGSWNWGGGPSGPEGQLPWSYPNTWDRFLYQANHGELIAFVGPDAFQGHWGDGSFFPQTTGYWRIGTSAQFISDKRGKLWLGFNDDAVSQSIADNSGTVTALISIAAGMPPTVTTDNATNVTSSSATLNGTLTSLGTSSNVTRSFQVGTSTNYTSETTGVTTNATGAFSFNLTGLSENTTYHYRAKVVGSSGTAYGVDRMFTTAPANFGSNLIANGNAEAGAGSTTGNEVVNVPGWTTNGNFTVIRYGATGGTFPTSSSPGPADRGTNLFTGGPDNGSSSASQVIDLSSLASGIDTGTATFALSGFLGGWQSQGDNAVLTAAFKSASNVTLHTTSIGPVTAAERSSQTGLLSRTASGNVSAGARRIDLTLQMTRTEGTYNDGYADSLSLILTQGTTPTPTPTPGNPYAWGSNSNGQLGDSTTSDRSTPLPVQNLTGVIAVSAGGVHSLALKAGGAVWAWGANAKGQVGDNTTSDRTTAVPVAGLSGIVAVSPGYNHSMALKSDGTVYVWGNNDYGQLGDNTTTDRSTPVPVQGLTGVIAVSGGVVHSLALKSDGTVWAWGGNDYGQLGTAGGNRLAPVQIANLTGVIAVEAGANHSLALRSDGTAWAWGRNAYGQLGDNTTTTYRSTPVQIANLTGVTAVSGGGNHSLALKSDGTVYAWGWNSNGQLGENTTTDTRVPVPVQGITGVVAISAGDVHSLALRSDGTVWAWGANVNGQLGDNTTTSRSTPVPVQNLTGVIAVSAGGVHSLAIAPTLTTITFISGNGPIGSRDPFNQFTLDAGSTWQDAYIPTPNPGTYSIIPGTNWINQNSTFSGPTYTTRRYRTTFVLPAGFSNPSLDVQVHADNVATLFLNGTQFGSQTHAEITSNFQGTPESFTVNNPALFLAGTNTLFFDIHNYSGPTGFDYKAIVSFSAVPAAQFIPFVSSRDGNLEVYRMSDNGSGQTRLTSDNGTDNMPSLSPDGSKVAFMSNRPGNREIYVMSSDNGSNLVRLTNEASGDNWPAWSPSGSRIAFASGRSGVGQIYTMSDNGSSLVQLTAHTGGASSMPAWSPDGSRIAFTSSREAMYGEIYVMNSDNGSNLVRLTNNPARDNFPAWSPDGTKIAFSSNRGGNWDIYVMNSDNGSNVVRLTNNAADDHQPVWSRDGSRIFFTSYRTGNAEVWVMNASGGGETQLTSNPGFGNWARGRWMHPDVVTDNATNITSNSARLNGNMTSMGSAGTVHLSFDWGTDNVTYGHQTPDLSANTIGPFFFDLTGLSPGTTYHFRASARGDGQGYGLNKTFTTAPAALVVTTDNATNVGGRSATLNGTLVSLGTSSNATTSFQWGLTDSYLFDTPAEFKNATGPFSFNLAGLTTNTTYHYRARAVGSSGTAYGVDRTFTTGAMDVLRDLPDFAIRGQTYPVSINFTAPAGGFSSLGITDFAPTGWTLAATKTWSNPAADQTLITSNATANKVELLWYSETYPAGAVFSAVYQFTVPPGAAAGSYSFAGGRLEYYSGSGQGPFTASVSGDFMLSVLAEPSVTTDNATEVSGRSAFLKGTVTSLGSSSNATVSFQYGLTTNYTAETPTGMVNATGPVSAFVSGLSENTTYHYRAKAVGLAGTGYGADRTFTTPVVNVLRDLPPFAAKGQTFQVSINFTAPAGGFSSLGLSDFVPVSWNVTANKLWNTPVSDQSNITANRVDYLWYSEVYAQGTTFTASYNVTVPAGATPGWYKFTGGVLEYYGGTGQGPFTAGVGGDFTLEIVEGARIEGVTRSANGDMLSGTTVTLDGAASVTSDASSVYRVTAATTGTHSLVASRTGYRNLTKTVNVTDLTATYTVDFKGPSGLVPNAPSLSYVLACINKWKFPPTDGTGLDLSKVLSVINAWKFPI